MKTTKKNKFTEKRVNRIFDQLGIEKNNQSDYVHRNDSVQDFLKIPTKNENQDKINYQIGYTLK